MAILTWGCLAACAWPTQAQHWGDALHAGGELGAIKAQFDSTWSDSTIHRGKGVKPFLRWWDFMRHRADPLQGAPTFKADAVWKATEAERMARQARSTSPPPIWTSATPSGLPLIGGAGRVNRVVIDPNDTARWVACAPSGGVWQSLESGEDWILLGTADWAGMGVSDLAFHPDDPQHLLAATGDGDFGSAYAVGLMQSLDGGQTWSTTGLSLALSETQTLHRVHRKLGAPEHILVASSDGLWLSEDNGLTFEQTLGGQFSDLLPHPGDSAVWHAAERPGRIYRSTDGGRHWTAVQGMPNPFLVSRYTLATSDQAPEQVWAIAARTSTQGLQGIYLSVDSGQTYTEVMDVPNLLGWTVDGSDYGGQGFYDLSLAVNPMNPDHVVAGGVNLWETRDAGNSWACIGHWYGADSVPEIHADHHAVAFVPGTGDWVSAHDGGVTRLFNGAPQDRSDGLEVGQIYRLAHSDMRPDLLLSGWQDNGVNLLDQGQHARVIGADGFHCLIDPLHPDTLYAAEYFGHVYRSLDGGWSWQDWVLSDGEGVHEQGDWNTPMAFAQDNAGRIFVAKHRLYWTDDGGMTWSQTDALPGPEMEVLALSAAADTVAMVARGAFAFRTENLSTWAPITGLPGLPVTDILMHPQHVQQVWIGFGGYDPDHRIWHSADGGATWDAVGSGLPALPVNTLALDTTSGDMLAGTDAGVYVLHAGATSWTPYKEGLPELICTDLAIRSSTGEVLLSSYGRGLWKAPLPTVPELDGACMRILGAAPPRCGAIPRVRLEFRNAGSDTLVAATVLWGEQDTIQYGFILPPNRTAELPWTDVLPDAIPWGHNVSARLLEVVGLDGSLTGGQLTAAIDDVAANDVAIARWEHRSASGPVIFGTTADCRPLETGWVLLDSAGMTCARRQHFPAETLILDTLCLTHGCYSMHIHDQGGNGWSSTDCGMQGDFAVSSVQGGVVWPQGPEEWTPDFGEAASWSLCLPQPGLTGCTDPAACNFNPAAGQEDGSCHYACPDPTCPGDLDGDGIHGATDILQLLAEFGCEIGCTRDINGDGAVSANDILTLLALYGTLCSE